MIFLLKFTKNHFSMSPRSDFKLFGIKHFKGRYRENWRFETFKGFSLLGKAKCVGKIRWFVFCSDFNYMFFFFFSLVLVNLNSRILKKRGHC